MKSTPLDDLEQIIKADQTASKEVVKGAEAMIRAMRERRAAFDSEKKQAEERIQRGVRLTKHRIPL
ncbi:hypothetical protein [Cupriavidus sp. a3]|uniref:hypothetical protein n=1 Tax=Cupriavidus sp. a3 TaxID=3242158 RepID=UPI003D9C2ABD